MSSRKPITLALAAMACDAAEDAGAEVAHWRKNTTLRRIDGYQVDLYVYDDLVASVLDNECILHAEIHNMTDLVWNRMNDVLYPLGWRLKWVQGHTYVCSIHKAPLAYRPGMNVVDVKYKVFNPTQEQA